MLFQSEKYLQRGEEVKNGQHLDTNVVRQILKTRGRSSGEEKDIKDGGNNFCQKSKLTVRGQKVIFTEKDKKRAIFIWVTF